MDSEQFINAVNRRYAAEGLPRLEQRDLPELAALTGTGRYFAERDVAHPVVKELLQKKQAKIQKLQMEQHCWLCQQPFIPTHNLELYLYCDLRTTPPENYCPRCLNKIIGELESRNEDLRCCS